MEREVLLAEILATAKELNIQCSVERGLVIAEFVNQHSENPLETLALAGDCIVVNDLRIIAAISNERELKIIGRGAWTVNIATKTATPIDKCPVVFTDKQILHWWLLERSGVSIMREEVRQAYIRDLISTNIDLYNQPRGFFGSIGWWLSPLSTRVNSARNALGESLFFRLPKPFTDYFYNDKVSTIAYYGALIDSMVRHRIITEVEARLLTDVFEEIYFISNHEVSVYD